MQRKIIRIGNSYGIIIPKNVLKALDWDVRSLNATIDTKKQQIVIDNSKK